VPICLTGLLARELPPEAFSLPGVVLVDVLRQEVAVVLRRVNPKPRLEWTGLWGSKARPLDGDLGTLAS
jgi:hypothetical protein